MTDDTSTANNDKGGKGLRFWAPLIATCLAMFIVVVDSTMMNVAIPAIVKDLNTMINAMQDTLLVIGFFILVCLLFSTFLPKRQARKTDPAERVESAEAPSSPV